MFSSGSSGGQLNATAKEPRIQEVDLEKGEKDSVKGLQTSQELDKTLVIFLATTSLLVLAVVMILVVGFTAKHGRMDAQAGLAAGEVTIAFAAFVVGLYRIMYHQ